MKDNQKKSYENDFFNLAEIRSETGVIYQQLQLSTSDSSNPYELEKDLEIRESSNSNSQFPVYQDGKEYKTSKNDELVSLKSIEELIEMTNISQLKNKVKFKRHSINYVICPYFNYAEAIIDCLKLKNEDKISLVNLLSQLKEIIKNNICTDKINFMIKMNDIKNNILKILIEKAINESKSEEYTKFCKVLFDILPSQRYSFELRFICLKAMLENKFGENQFTRELDDILEKKVLKTNPWIEKKTESIKTVCHKLRNDLLSNKRKSIFTISKDYTESIRQNDFDIYSNIDLNLNESQIYVDANFNNFGKEVSNSSCDIENDIFNSSDYFNYEDTSHSISGNKDFFLD